MRNFYFIQSFVAVFLIALKCQSLGGVNGIELWYLTVFLDSNL